MLEVKNVSYAYKTKKDKTILNNVSATFEEGIFYTIVGPSGAGKTTLLSLLAGLDTAVKGTVLCNGEDITKKGLNYHRKHNISLVFQNYNLIDYLTTVENVKLGGSGNAEKLLEEVGIGKEYWQRNVLQPLVLRNFTYTETGYPLNVQTKADASDERFKKIWEISERTLRCCMHETYEDCPFYEQLQYAMDTRAQILYTYAISADDRLARKCMEDFRRSQRYDGLLNCAAPRYDASVIPGFSIYYILMLYDHMMYFGDKELLENHMPTVEGILQFFHRNRNSKGYVEKIGGLNGKARFWSFIDWAVEWENTTGIPPAVLKGPVTMESLLYILGLQKAAKIAEYLDRKEQSALLMQRAEQVQEAVRTFCTGKDGMLQDGPGIEEYSQHTQVFAVLTDTVAGEQAKENLRKTILYKEKYSQCSVAMVYYLFRALEKTGMYELTESYWNIWQRMIDKYTTTCVEDEVQERSECHAWGALILYELPSVILGIRPSAPGYEKMEVKPVPGYLKSARGQVITPKGMVNVEWYRENKEIHIKLETSEGKVEKEMEVQE